MPTDPILTASGIVVRFGDVTALDGVDLEVKRGSIYGLLGPNGAGKTTLIRVLSTLLDPVEGSASVAGIDILANHALARTKIGLAGQFAAVDEYQTGRENVQMIGRLYRLSRDEARRRTAEILEVIGLTDAADRRVSTYSGGMRRRLDLAASLIGRPEVMFLDEPTTGIDPRSRVGVWDLVRDLVASGTTVLLTTQYLEEADQLANRIGVINHGRIITEGTADELKDTLGGTIIEVEVHGDDLGRAADVLAGVAQGEIAVDGDRGVVRVPATADASTMFAVTGALEHADLRPTDITTVKPTLDDVFLAVTEDGAEPARPGRGDDDAAEVPA
jgi:ABC-2 type transport system ATP-binding protein